MNKDFLQEREFWLYEAHFPVSAPLRDKYYVLRTYPFMPNYQIAFLLQLMLLEELFFFQSSFLECVLLSPFLLINLKIEL